MKANIMIDLETLGTKPGCKILTIGAVEFTRDGLGREFYERVDIRDASLAVDRRTLSWWHKQDNAAIAEAFGGTRSLVDVLERFVDWYPFDGAWVWGNAASFDLKILEAAFDAVGMATPWNFWEEMCYRTLKNLIIVPMDEFEGVRHHALHDAKHQAKHCIRLLERVN